MFVLQISHLRFVLYCRLEAVSYVIRACTLEMICLEVIYRLTPSLCGAVRMDLRYFGE